jgi:hypothetical protein
VPNIFNILLCIYILYMFFDILIWELVNSYGTIFPEVKICSQATLVWTPDQLLHRPFLGPEAGRWKPRTCSLLLQWLASLRVRMERATDLEKLKPRKTQTQIASAGCNILLSKQACHSITNFKGVMRQSLFHPWWSIKPCNRITTGSRLVTYFASQICRYHVDICRYCYCNCSWPLRTSLASPACAWGFAEKWLPHSTCQWLLHWPRTRFNRARLMPVSALTSPGFVQFGFGWI